MTRPYAEVIGDPIAHSKSPLIHNFWLEKLGIDAEYRSCHVHLEGLAKYFTERREDGNWRGCNVTLPHKQQVLSLVDLVDEKAVAIGASNCVYRNSYGQLVATNTDVDGVAAAIEDIDLAGADVCVLGAGGAARAAFYALKDRRCSLLVLARDPEKAVTASASAGCPGIGVPFKPDNTALLAANLFINATQLGMEGQEPMPVFVLHDLADMADDATVFDMVYAPLQTPLLVAAQDRGLRSSDGLVMLVAQARTAFSLFFSAAPPREDDAELRERLLA